MSDFSWDNFKQCFKEKFPYSTLIYPCLPCASDDQSNLLWYASFVLVGLFFLLKVILRNNIVWADFLDRDIWAVYYFIMIYTLITIILIIYLNLNEEDKRRRWRAVLLNSIGVAILFFTSTFVSMKFYDYLVYFPIFGQIIYRITQLIETWTGPNAPRILLSWWGVSLCPLVALIPVVGPFIAGILMFIPQNLFLMWLGYISVCLVAKFS